MLTQDILTRMLSLAASLESEGQYNNAKLLRAGVDALMTGAAYRQRLPNDRETMLAETDRLIEALSSLSFAPEYLFAIHQARSALAEGRLPYYAQTPDPYVCRICGTLALDNSAACPACGADPGTFQRFRPIYWIKALDPIESLDHLRAMPARVARLLDGISENRAGQASRGWSLRQAVSHLSDAQGVLDHRVGLILEQDNPVLAAKAVFEWAGDDGGRPSTVAEIFEAYRGSRASTVARLESLPLRDWRRCGRHEEFGELRLYEQVSYFASHELTHVHQLETLARDAK